jgi:hypothetical protein
MVTGEKILVDHPATETASILSELGSNAFLLFTEVRSGTSTPSRDIIIGTGQIVLVRAMDELSTQSTTFRPKR